MSFEFWRGISSTAESLMFPIQIFVVRPPRYFFHCRNAGASGIYAIFDPSGETAACPPAIGNGSSVGRPSPLTGIVYIFGTGSPVPRVDKKTTREPSGVQPIAWSAPG